MSDGPQFDVDGARKAGISDDQILTEMRTKMGGQFDFDGALKAGVPKADIINELAKGTAKQPSMPGTGGLPPMPTATIPEGLQPRAQQQAMGGPPQYVNVPTTVGQLQRGPQGQPGQLPADIATNYQQAGQRGYQTGGQIGAGMLAVPQTLAAPGAALGSMVGGYVTGKGTEAITKAYGGGEDARALARAGGNIIGSIPGGLMGESIQSGMVQGLRQVGNKIMQSATGEESPWATLLSMGTSVPKSLIKLVVGSMKTAPEPAQPEAFLPGATRTNVPVGNAQLPAPGAAQPAPQFVSQFSKPTVPEPEPTSVPLTQSPYANQYQAVVAAQRAAARAALKPQPSPEAPPPAMFPGATPSNAPVSGGAQLPQVVPQGAPTPFGKPQLVRKFTPPAQPEPSRIALPGSPAPSQKVTYQSYDGPTLLKMAKMGNIDAGLELIRNPRGMELPPNFKYLIEETAKKIPWRNKPE